MQELHLSKLEQVAQVESQASQLFVFKNVPAGQVHDFLSLDNVPRENPGLQTKHWF